MSKEKSQKLNPTWPEKWPKETRVKCFLEIVSKEMPKDEEKAYTELLKVVKLKAAKETLRTTATGGPACFGVKWEEDSPMCSEICSIMPLCREVFETRPDLKIQFDKLLKSKKKTAKNKKQKKEIKYVFIGDLSTYDTTDKIFKKIYKWIEKQKSGFTEQSLSKVYSNLGWGKGVKALKAAKETIKFLKAQKDLEKTV
jgi:hypothetical protein